MLNWAVRYAPATAVVRAWGVSGVLDVGSGVHGLSRYWDGPVVQTDLNFEGVSCGPVPLVAARAEALPFTDNAFELVVSLDMMEHLPVEIRVQAVREMLRVSSGPVLVGYPCGIGAQRSDSTLLAYLRRFRLTVPGWLTEHREQERYPDETLITDSLPEGTVVLDMVANANAWSHTALSVLESTPGLARWPLLLDRPVIWARLSRRPARGTPYRRIYLIGPPSERRTLVHP